MVADIVNQMAEIVANIMTSFQSDFEKHDAEYIKRKGVNAFPFLWMVAPNHTYLLKMADFKKRYFENEALRYVIAQKNSWFHAYLLGVDGNVKETIFYVTLDGVREVSTEQAREIVRGIIHPVVEEWAQKNGKIPTKSRITICIAGISLSRLKSMIQDCRNHGDDSLLECFKRFRDYRQIAKDHKVCVRYIESCNAFSFCELINGKCGVSGGIVFHGWPETGYATNNSFQIEPQYGWAIHT